MYPAGTPKRSWLSWYTRMFNAVEGNSSFYAIPTVDTARRWAGEAAAGFQFCMKFPREVSHEHALVGAQAATRLFLDALNVLRQAERLGPTFLQLGPEFGPDRAAVLEAYLDELPPEMSWAVEVRHPGWFDSGPNEQRINEMLRQRQMDKVLFDSRALFQLPPDDQIENASQKRKPKTPVRQTVTGRRPMLRLVGRNQLDLVDRFTEQWVQIVADWIAQGLQPYIFAHAPNDALAPELARRFWNRLAPLLPPPQPELPRLPAKPRQLELL